MTVIMENATLTGAICGAPLSMDEKSRWTATGDSSVVLNGDLNPAQIDAVSGVTITAVGAEAMEAVLPSGGKLVIVSK